jgi:hypothetical protein
MLCRSEGGREGPDISFDKAFLSFAKEGSL